MIELSDNSIENNAQLFCKRAYTSLNISRDLLLFVLVLFVALLANYNASKAANRHTVNSSIDQIIAQKPYYVSRSLIGLRAQNIIRRGYTKLCLLFVCFRRTTPSSFCLLEYK